MFDKKRILCNMGIVSFGGTKCSFTVIIGVVSSSTVDICDNACFEPTTEHAKNWCYLRR